ncbi:cell adhesion molecule-related/down-regulated by oncogenes-like [Paramormyrops kingsleyae]|uniref:cell adhesion molecule-related/down-regulated by oncogenes-like n=1 Tax=Paramormyrops kingsleyae TaxID=1676925 RepID=UPI003B97B665
MDTLWTLLYAALCLSQAPPFSCTDTSLSFRLEPLSVVQRPGGLVLLRCAARQPTALLSWLFQGRPLDSGSAGGALRLRPGLLTLPSLQHSQAGRYQCVARTETGTIASRLARVTVAEMADFAESRRRAVTVEQGGAVLIACLMPPSTPPALPRLRVRGEWLEQSTDEYLILPSGNLQIASASPHHQGVYKCGAYNPVTQETRLETHGTKLAVRQPRGLSPLRLIHPLVPQTLVVQQSNDITLECILEGSQAPQVRWTKDGQEVAMGSSHRMVLNNLLLMGVGPSDSGTYQCSASSRTGGMVTANYTIVVQEPASVTQGLTDQSVPVGSSVVFTCVTKGNPSPNITWLFNSAPIMPSARLQIFGSSLHVSNASGEDQGMFQCLVDNGIGSAQSTGRLSILSALSSRPQIWAPPSGGHFLEGAPVSLSCNASGQPLPVIHWYNAAGPIASHPSRLLQPVEATTRAFPDVSPYVIVSRPGSSLLFIQAVSVAQAGKYTCEASNKLGSVTAEASLFVGPPASSTVGPTSSTPLPNSPVQNDEGEEPPGQEEGPSYEVDTPAERPSDLPTPEAPIITSPPQTHRHDAYDLQWRPGRAWGRPIHAYFVRYRKLDDQTNVAGSWHTIRVPGSEKSLRLSDLEPSSLYEVLMVARSAGGDGQPAMLTFRTSRERNAPSSKSPSKVPFLAVPEKSQERDSSSTHFGVVMHDRVPEAPDRPTISMATESSVYVTWIPRANGGSPITAFRVEYRQQNRGATWLVAADNISPLKLSVEVPDLEPGSSYRFRVIALNMYGESPHSAPSRPYQVSSASPPLTVRPVAGPHISSTDAISDTQIMLRWTYTPSSNNNTPIQGFYIYYRPTDSDNDSDYKREVVEGNKESHLIGQLQPETSYDIKMQCFNDGGESEYSNVMICETKARQAPGAPPEHPITPSGPYLPAASMPAGGLLYLIVGGVLAIMVFILLVFIVMCLWRNRQQRTVHKFDPNGYLYQPPEMNGHMMEYTTLPNGGHSNGYGHGGSLPPPACHHLHHKLPNGVTLLNGSPAHYPHDHAHSHQPPSGGRVYVPSQPESVDCTSCQNFCNNNRCYTKANGAFPGGTHPIVHRASPCAQDGLELLPLAHMSPPTNGPDSQWHVREGDRGSVGEPDEAQATLPSSQNSCCQSSKEGERGSRCGGADDPLRCWESRDLPKLDQSGCAGRHLQAAE